MLSEIFGGNLEIGEVKDAKLTFTGAVAINAGNGRYKVYDAVKKTVVDTTELSMDGKGLIMKLPVQKVVEGDVTVRNGRFYFVKGSNEDGEIKVVSLDDSKIETFAPETNLYGVNFYTKVVSVLNMAGGVGATTNPMQMIMMTKLLGNKNKLTQDDDMLTMLALTSLQGNGTGFEAMFQNPMMLLMLMGDKGSSGLSGILPLMIMSGTNPFATPVAPTKTTTVDPKDAVIAQLQKTVKELSKPAKAAKAPKTEAVVTPAE